MTDEERAEEYADDTRIIDENTRVGDDCISLVQDFEGNTLDIHERIKRAFLDGFHSDRWHYPSKGELPTVGSFNPYMSDKCFVYVDEDGINKHLDMAYYDFREKGWVKFPVPAREEWLNVYAWQLIEPPKEEE